MFFNKLKQKKNKININKKNNNKNNLSQKETSLYDNLKNNLFNEDDDNNNYFKFKTKFSFKRLKTQKIIKELNNNKIKSLLFYTHISNILRQLEFGIQPIKNIYLEKKSEYIVWTYLEKYDHLEFELDNSTRYYFWNWIAEQKVDPTKISILSINIENLFYLTKKNWEYDYITRRIKIFENVNSKAINWILVKNNQYLNRIITYIKDNNLKLKIFQGEKGNISDILTENKK